MYYINIKIIFYYLFFLNNIFLINKIFLIIKFNIKVQKKNYFLLKWKIKVILK